MDNAPKLIDLERERHRRLLENEKRRLRKLARKARKLCKQGFLVCQVANLLDCSIDDVRELLADDVP